MTQETVDERVQKTTVAVGGVLAEWGRMFRRVDATCFRGRQGSADIEVRVAIRGTRPWVDVRACVVSGAVLDTDLMYALLLLNDELPLAHFSLDKQGQIWCRHTLLGEAFNGDELKAAVRSVAKTANQYDDLIQKRAGGGRAIDPAPKER